MDFPSPILMSVLGVSLVSIFQMCFVGDPDGQEHGRASAKQINQTHTRTHTHPRERLVHISQINQEM